MICMRCANKACLHHIHLFYWIILNSCWRSSDYCILLWHPGKVCNLRRVKLIRDRISGGCNKSVTNRAHDHTIPKQRCAPRSLSVGIRALCCIHPSTHFPLLHSAPFSWRADFNLIQARHIWSPRGIRATVPLQFMQMHLAKVDSTSKKAYLLVSIFYFCPRYFIKSSLKISWIDLCAIICLILWITLFNTIIYCFVEYVRKRVFIKMYSACL